MTTTDTDPISRLEEAVAALAVEQRRSVEAVEQLAAVVRQLTAELDARTQ
jgi:hypothetical protein